jgi:hypothetical protein
MNFDVTRFTDANNASYRILMADTKNMLGQVGHVQVHRFNLPGWSWISQQQFVGCAPFRKVTIWKWVHFFRMRKSLTQDITEYYMRQVYLTADVDDIYEKFETFKSDIIGAGEYFERKEEGGYGPSRGRWYIEICGVYLSSDFGIAC